MKFHNYQWVIPRQITPPKKFETVLSEIWALKVLLKQPKLARLPHKQPATTPKI